MILQQKQFTPAEVMTNRIMIPVSLSETLSDLKTRGYKFKFRRESTCLYCVELGSWFTADSFFADEYYHFENNSGTCGDTMLYAITSTLGLKGFLVDTCVVREDTLSRGITEEPELEYMLAAAF